MRRSTLLTPPTAEKEREEVDRVERKAVRPRDPAFRVPFGHCLVRLVDRLGAALLVLVALPAVLVGHWGTFFSLPRPKSGDAPTTVVVLVFGDWWNQRQIAE